MAIVPNGFKIAENFNRLSGVHEHCRVTTDRRQTDGREHSERERENVSSCSLKSCVILWTKNTKFRLPLKLSLLLGLFPKSDKASLQ